MSFSSMHNMTTNVPSTLIVHKVSQARGDELYQLNMSDIPADLQAAIMKEISKGMNVFFRGDNDRVADRLMYRSEDDDDEDDDEDDEDEAKVKKVEIPRTLVSSCCYEGGKMTAGTFVIRGCNDALVIVIGDTA